jgi:hypothetical protein
MRGKKGSGHFEMVIGFIFFIGSVFFMFMFLSPWDSSSLSNSALERLYDSFEEEVNTNLSSVFIGAEYTGDKTCFRIDLPSELFVKYGASGDGSLVTLLGGVEIASSIATGETLELNNNGDFFRVAISPEFTNDGLGDCEDLDVFELGGVLELQVVSHSKLTEMHEKYYSDYNGLKRDLKVADIFNFAIVPEDMPELVMMPAGGVPDSVEVLARDYVIKILKSDGAVSNERISFRIW